MYYGDYFFLSFTSDVSGSGVGFGLSAGFSNYTGNFPGRICDDSYNGYDTTNRVCVVKLYKNVNEFYNNP